MRLILIIILLIIIDSSFAKKNGLLTAGTKRIQQHLEASRDSIASKDASNMFAENTVAKRKEHECLLAKAKTIVPLANDLIEQLKPRLIGALKARSFNIPLNMKGLSIQPVKIEHVNFKSVKIEHRGNRLKLKIKGLSLRIKKVGIRLNRKLFGLFLMQISEKAKHRRLFLRNKNSARLRKGGKKKKIERENLRREAPPRKGPLQEDVLCATCCPAK